jgi:hypothetical protein
MLRTVEVLRSLGLAETFIANGKRIPERAYWVSFAFGVATMFLD